MAASANQPHDPRPALQGELERALALIRPGRAPTDEAVHEIRRALKRARALLRLMRDARILLDKARTAPPELRRALRDEYRTSHAGLRAPRSLDAVRAAIEGCAARTSRWRMPRPAWPVVVRGIERIYRQGREALDEAQARPTDRALHEARKQR